ncbi:hypothetical protein MBANPS3_012413 [Mucor bainieri]
MTSFLSQSPATTTSQPHFGENQPTASNNSCPEASNNNHSEASNSSHPGASSNSSHPEESSSSSSNDNDAQPSHEADIYNVKGSKISIEDVKEYDANLAGFVDILEISSIKYNDESAAMEDARLDENLTSLLGYWAKACKKETKFAPATACSLHIISNLYILHHNIIHQIPGLTHLRNHEEEFKTKHVYPLLCLVFPEFTIRCDVASEAYQTTDTNNFKTIRPDFLMLHESVELITVEVKPCNTAKSLIDEDEVRVAELSKKIMHRRMTKAKTVKEFCSFGICMVGEKMDLYKLEFNNGQYNYSKLDTITLPTMKHTYTHMQLSLEALFAFKNLVLSTLPNKDEILLPYLTNVTTKMKPTTLYLL